MRRSLTSTTNRDRLTNTIAELKRKSTLAFIALLVVISTAAFAFEHSIWPATDQNASLVISEDEKPAFLEYVRGENPRSLSSLEQVSVGDALPDTGVLYYAIPLRYGHSSLRWTVVGSHILIVDRITRAVVQVVD